MAKIPGYVRTLGTLAVPLIAKLGSVFRLRLASLRVSGAWLVVASIIVAAGLLSLGAAILVEMHRTAWQNALQTTSNVVATIEADIARNLELYDLCLQGVIDNLNEPEVQELSPKLRQSILFDRAAIPKYLGGILAINERGYVIAKSNENKPRFDNYSTHDYFRAHRDDPNVGLYIGRPFISSTSGKLVITISRRLSHQDGSFAGVVAGTLRLDYFRDLFRRVELGPAAGMGVYRLDGMLITRFPFRDSDSGLNIGRGLMFERALVKPSGYHEATASTDGVRRLYSYRRVGALPLLVSAGMSLETVYADWWKEAVIISTVGLMLAGSTITLAMFAAYELRRRAHAESKLVDLANTDALTGLRNLRGFSFQPLQANQ
jgi:histidine kinase family protein